MTKIDPRKLRIARYPDSALKRRAESVEQFGPELKRLADAMFELMRGSKGVGLAAPQVGQPIRLFICNATTQPQDDLICINPTLHDLTGSAEQQEGCLSLPGVTVTMRRATHVVLRAFDVEGRPFERLANGLLARVWQHEIDHLDGRLIIDRMSVADEIANRRALRQLETEFASKRRRRGGGH